MSHATWEYLTLRVNWQFEGWNSPATRWRWTVDPAHQAMYAE